MFGNVGSDAGSGAGSAGVGVGVGAGAGAVGSAMAGGAVSFLRRLLGFFTGRGGISA